MITRAMNYNEVLDHEWKMYKYDITEQTTKNSIVNFTNSLLIKTNELEFNKYPVYIDPVTTNIIIITKQNEKILTEYNHIYKSGSIKILYNGNWTNFSQLKNKIKTIYFMDNINLHNNLKGCWSEAGFKWDQERINKTKQMILNSIT